MAFALASSSAFLRLPGDDRPLETDLRGDAALRDRPPKTAATPALELLRAKGLGRAPAAAAAAAAGAAAGIDAGVVLPPLGLGPPPGLATAGGAAVAAELWAASVSFLASASFSAGVFSPARLRSAPAT